MAVAVRPAPAGYEELVTGVGERSGARMTVAVHSTALGPALGGLRMWPYPSPEDAEADALRLAEGMTLKAAAAGLELGGGKGVVCVPGGGWAGESQREAALRDFGDLVEALDGRYITAEDVGITPADLVIVAEHTSHLTGLPPANGGSGDPSPVTAIGVEAAMRACANHRYGDSELSGLRVCIIGLGHVGTYLAELLAAHGCELAVADIDPARRGEAERLGAEWVPPQAALFADCHVLAPCALGGSIDAASHEALRCEIVCGSANNQLAHESLAGELGARGILYAPDFVANAGGLINVFRELRGQSAESALERARSIEDAMGRILATAAARDITPLDAARELAAERLGEAGLRD